MFANNFFNISHYRIISKNEVYYKNHNKTHQNSKINFKNPSFSRIFLHKKMTVANVKLKKGV